MRIKPLNDRVLVKRLEAEERTKGGIVLPETAKEKPKEGEVIAIGPGKMLESGKRQTLELKKGDKIIFESYAGTEIKIDGKEYLLMKEDDVLGIIEK